VSRTRIPVTASCVSNILGLFVMMDEQLLLTILSVWDCNIIELRLWYHLAFFHIRTWLNVGIRSATEWNANPTVEALQLAVLLCLAPINVSPSHSRE
jgi:hypothetical protein